MDQSGRSVSRKEKKKLKIKKKKKKHGFEYDLTYSCDLMKVSLNEETKEIQIFWKRTRKKKGKKKDKY